MEENDGTIRRDGPNTWPVKYPLSFIFEERHGKVMFYIHLDAVLVSGILDSPPKKNEHVFIIITAVGQCFYT